MLEVRLLGQFEVLRDGRRLTIPTRNAQSLFAYLILSAGKAIRREKLAGLLWPDSSEENARSNLRHELWRLRKALETGGEAYFLIDDLTISFNLESDYSLDVDRLESVPTEESNTEELIAALSTYQGELLPGFYEEWVFVERDRLYALFESKIAHLLEILQHQGRWGEVQDWATRWIALGQWPELAYRTLMIAYANSGDLAKAVATYERFSHGLQKELGIQPSTLTQAYYKRIKTGWKIEATPETQTREPPAPKPETDKAVVPFSLPRMRRSNLPKPLTSFIGREKEIQLVEALVSQSRLVTITGAGGVGKTRLAIQVAEALEPHFRDGAWWVELAPLFKTSSTQKRDRSIQDITIEPKEDLVAQAVAKALRAREVPGQHILDTVLEHLHDKQLLLVLDNSEHLIEDCAALAERLLNDCPQVSILATSREALGVPGEKAWYLPSLSLPWRWHSMDARGILQSEAASLFVERTVDILPDYQPSEADVPTIAQICLRLDGIPLAIELAAARMNLLSAQEIAARLDRRFSLLTSGRRTTLPRHQTLHAAIEWSYDLLGEAEKVLLRRLSIFAGSFTLEGAEAVCSGEGIRRDEVLTLIGRLVDKSLLQVEPMQRNPDFPTRYRFLETIRSFGLLKLENAEETWMMRDRHAAYYVSLVEVAEPELLLKNQVRWLKLLKAENDNVRAVIGWSAESDQPESALRLVGALLWFWFRSGSNREGHDLAFKALDSPSAFKFMKARGRAMITAGFMQCLLGDINSARDTLEEATSILRETDDKAALAWALQFLGLIFSLDRDYDRADAAIQEGLEITRKLGATNTFVFFLGDIDYQKGDRPRAKRIYEESVERLRVIGNKGFLAYPLRRLGYLALEENDIPTASKYLLESLKLNHEIGDMPGVTASLASLATLAIYLDKPLIAARLVGTVENLLESLSVNLLYLDQVELGRVSSKLTSLMDETTFAVEFAKGWELSDDEAIELAMGAFGWVDR